MTATWMPIGFAGYIVSSTGQVIGPRGRALRASLAGEKGYLRVTIHSDRRRLTRYVHTLVCAIFNGAKPGPNYHAAHLDGDKFNNAASNLAWKRPVDNELDKIRHGTYNHHGELNPNSRLTADEVRAIRAAYASGGITQAALASTFDVSQGYISGLVRGVYWPP